MAYVGYLRKTQFGENTYNCKSCRYLQTSSVRCPFLKGERCAHSITGLLIAAKRDNPHDMLYLAYCFLNGIGVKQSPWKALRMTKKLAKIGYAPAQYFFAQWFCASEKSKIGNYYYDEAAKQGCTYAVNRWIEKRSDDAESLPEWLYLSADSGNETAQLFLGKCYLEGRHVAQNYKQAAAWLKRAWELGDKNATKLLLECYENHFPECCDEKHTELYKLAVAGNQHAQTALGKLYLDSDFMPSNDGKATQLLTLAANQGCAEAQYTLAECFKKGRGVARNEQESTRLYKLAAQQKHGPAQKELAKCYEQGIGIEKNPELAAKWYLCAAEQADMEGQIAYAHLCRNRKAYAEAFKWYTEAAKQGAAVAQYHLGRLYYTGCGTVKNYAEAIDWFRTAAQQGDPSSQYMLGLCYENGHGVQKDADQMLYWYGLAAEKNNDDALLRLAAYYLEKEHQDLKKAAAWYKRAADRGSTLGKTKLGLCYLNGTGIEKNEFMAFELFRSAAEAGNAEAQGYLGWCYSRGKGISLSRAEWKPNYFRAVDLYKKALPSGLAFVQTELGWCYYYGKGVDKNYAEAFKLLTLAVQQKHAYASYMLGDCYFYGNGTAKNPQEAVKWYQFAAQNNVAAAQAQLAYCYEKGSGIGKNMAEAIKWYNLSAEKGNAYAHARLGYVYGTGNGVKKDYYTAIKHYRIAAEQNINWAQRNLGLLYEEGLGVSKDLEEAQRWYQTALNNGYECSADLNRVRHAIDLDKSIANLPILDVGLDTFEIPTIADINTAMPMSSDGTGI